MTTKPLFDHQPQVAVDFDQTVFPYTKGWTGAVPDDEPPTHGALEFLRALKVKGFRVIIFSVRAATPEGKAGIQNWLAKYGLAPFVDEISSEKPHAVAYVDDRAVPFTGDWMAALKGVDILFAKEKKRKEALL